MSVFVTIFNLINHLFLMHTRCHTLVKNYGAHISSQSNIQTHWNNSLHIFFTYFSHTAQKRHISNSTEDSSFSHECSNKSCQHISYKSTIKQNVAFVVSGTSFCNMKVLCPSLKNGAPKILYTLKISYRNDIVCQ